MEILIFSEDNGQLLHQFSGCEEMVKPNQEIEFESPVLKGKEYYIEDGRYNIIWVSDKINNIIQFAVVRYIENSGKKIFTISGRKKIKSIIENISNNINELNKLGFDTSNIKLNNIKYIMKDFDNSK